MILFTIFCLILFLASAYLFYRCVKKSQLIQKYFYLKLFFSLLGLVVLSIVCFYLLALGNSGHHVDTDLENILENACAILLFGAVADSLIGLFIALIKGLRLRHKME